MKKKSGIKIVFFFCFASWTEFCCCQTQLLTARSVQLRVEKMAHCISLGSVVRELVEQTQWWATREEKRAKIENMKHRDRAKRVSIVCVCFAMNLPCVPSWHCTCITVVFGHCLHAVMAAKIRRASRWRRLISRSVVLRFCFLCVIQTDVYSASHSLSGW